MCLASTTKAFASTASENSPVLEAEGDVVVSCVRGSCVGSVGDDLMFLVLRVVHYFYVDSCAELSCDFAGCGCNEPRLMFESLFCRRVGMSSEIPLVMFSSPRGVKFGGESSHLIGIEFSATQRFVLD